MRRTWLALIALLLTASSVGGVRADGIVRLDSLLTAAPGPRTAEIVDSLMPGARARGDSATIRILLTHRGWCEVAFLNRSRRAEDSLREALALTEAAGDSSRLCRILRWLGVAVDNQGRADEATEIYHELIAAARAQGDVHHEGWGNVGLAWRHLVTGRAVESAERYRSAIDLFEQAGEMSAKVWALNGLAMCLAKQGKVREAEAAHREVVTTARMLGDRYMEAQAENNTGVLAYERGAVDLALPCFRRARDLHLELGSRKAAASPAFNVVFCLTVMDRFDEAQAAASDLLDQAREFGWPDIEALTLKQIATLEMYRGRLQLAASVYREGLEKESLVPLKTSMELRQGLAQALTQAGRADEALAVLLEGEGMLADTSDIGLGIQMEINLGKVYLALGEDEEALTRFRRTETLAREANQTIEQVPALIGVATAQKRLGRLDEELASLRLGVSVWDSLRDIPRDPEWREHFGSFGRSLSTRLAQALLAAGEDAGAIFDEVQRFKARTLLERMLGGGEAVEVVTLERLQSEVLFEGELLLDLYLGEEESTLFAVTRNRCEAVGLPAREDLASRLRALHTLVSRPPLDRSSSSDEAVILSSTRALHDQLFGEIEDLIAASPSVVLIPDGSTNLLVTALLGGEGRVPLWTRVPSATLLAGIRSNDGGSKSEAVGGLALDGSDPSGLEELPGARSEVSHLAHRYRGVDSRALSTLDSTEITHLLPEPGGFLHLATHARIDDQNPWQSGLHLGSAGWMPAADIARSSFDARLVVLAACASASGRMNTGEGVLGLTSAFLAAGVPAVVATLWAVDDRATAHFSELFYAALAEGHGSGESLRLAQELLRSEPGMSHPFFWAGFVLVGDGEPGLALEKRSLLDREGKRAGLLLLGLGLVMLALRGARRGG